MAPMSRNAKIAIGWSCAITAAVTTFILSKRTIDKKRVEAMKSRRRMRDATIGDYQPERFRKDMYDYNKKP